MGYMTDINGSIDIEPKPGNTISQEDLTAAVEKGVEEAGDLHFWVGSIEGSENPEVVECGIFISAQGKEAGFGDDFEEFVQAMDTQGLLVSGEILGFGEDPDDRWKMDITHNKTRYFIAEITVAYQERESFEKATRGW